jgi:hypothetical protein
MWLASFRLTEVIALNHPLNRLRHELRLHNLCEEIVLDPFSEQEVADYVAERSPLHAKADAFVGALYECTDGVPLFVASAMSDVLTRAAREGDAAHAVAQSADVAVPENLTATIDRYIDKLGSERRMLLSAAAVCGVEFRVSTISAAIVRDPVWAGQICEELAREQLWLTPPRAEPRSESAERPYSFRHALFRQALYERTAPAARAQLHRRIGTALERERAAGEPVADADLAMHFERGGEPMSALRYYAQAAEGALLDFRSDRCMTLTERALTLLDQVSEKTERNKLEVTLATLRGVAATQLLGVDLEAKSAFQRAYGLLPDVPQHPMSRRLLHGLGFLLCLRAEYAEALAVAKQAQALSSETNDPVLVLAACIVHADVDQLQGRWPTACTWAERGLALVEPLEVASGETFVADPQVTLLGLLAIPLLNLGLVEQGRECLQRGHIRARALRQPMTRLVAIWYNALFEVRLGNAQRVAALADEMRALVDEFELAHGRHGWRWFRAWADARTGAPREAHRRIREAYQQNARLGMLTGGSEVLGYATEALVLAGDWDAAEEQLQEALQAAHTQAERVYLPQLFLIQAAIARARGQSGAAHGCVRQALAEARAQEAPWLELMALLELCEHDGAKAEDRHALAALVDQLPEASNTTAVTRASALLAR